MQWQCNGLDFKSTYLLNCKFSSLFVSFLYFSLNRLFTLRLVPPSISYLLYSCNTFLPDKIAYYWRDKFTEMLELDLRRAET